MQIISILHLGSKFSRYRVYLQSLSLLGLYAHFCNALVSLLDIPCFPSSKAVGAWLHRMSKEQGVIKASKLLISICSKLH